MLARTRVDVDALNARARAAAITNSEVTGPVTAAGDRDWQAGDLLRTRRNNRCLPIGDSHVRNGDRFRVLGPGPAGGLIVEDLAGRGRLTSRMTIWPSTASTAGRPPSTPPKAPPPTSGSFWSAPAWTANTSMSR